jgi:hypothetical protein
MFDRSIERHLDNTAALLNSTAYNNIRFIYDGARWKVKQRTKLNKIDLRKCTDRVSHILTNYDKNITGRFLNFHCFTAAVLDVFRIQKVGFQSLTVVLMNTFMFWAPKQ